MPVVRKADLTPVTGTSYPAPYDAGMGRYQAWELSEAGGLTQFGAALETLAPGARSSQRHWHENEDEFLYMLEGELTLIEDDGDHTLRPGDACTWAAGAENGHCLENRTDTPATFLIVGTKASEDVVHYPDIDLVYSRRDGKSVFTSRDGTKLKGKSS